MLDYLKLATPFLPSPKMVYEDIQQDQKIKTSYSLCSKAVKKGKHRKSKLKQRLKLEVVRNKLIDYKLVEWCKKIHTIIGIKNRLVLDYFENFDEYDVLMKQLDELLDDNILSKIEPIEYPHNKQITQKISDMVLEHFSSFNKYLDKYKGDPLQRAKARQYHTYFTKRGVYRFHSRIGREFYLKTGTPPFTIV